ncbi:hypothetical protein ERO13_A03G104050v2, partial [Gossypium hirsutum]
ALHVIAGGSFGHCYHETYSTGSYNGETVSLTEHNYLFIVRLLNCHMSFLYVQLPFCSFFSCSKEKIFYTLA